MLGVIDAHGETSSMRRSRSWPADLRGRCNQLRDDLLQLLAELEAGSTLSTKISNSFRTTKLCERLRIGKQIARRRCAANGVAIDVQDRLRRSHWSARPNVGKSSLFNAMVDDGVHADREHATRRPALVSPQRGTTRDYLTAHHRSRRDAGANLSIQLALTCATLATKSRIRSDSAAQVVACGSP